MKTRSWIIAGGACAALGAPALHAEL
ncbi:DUF4142 domain-containing protein, partial [Burkholderia pseudomallei]